MSVRYAIVSQSLSQHCCFTHSVVDTTKRTDIGSPWPEGPIKPEQCETVCECFDEESANLVVEALNR